MTAHQQYNTPVIGAPDDSIGAQLAQLDHIQVMRELIERGGLHEFIRLFWNDPRDFSDGWHIGAMCEYLMAVTAGDIKRLVINVPPGHMKSLACGVYWPAWMWGQDDGKSQILCGSFDQSLLNNQSEKLISILQSYEYRALYPAVKLKNKTPALREFKTATGGFRFNTSPEGKGTGRHVDGLLIDDPMKPQDAILQREAAFKKVNSWFDGTLQTRVRKWIVVIMQRLHTDDIAGRCIAEGYESLILPARQVKRTMWARDPRKEVGELLWPEVFPEERVRQQEIKLANEASAQLQQDPTPASGGIVEEPWTRLEWVEPPSKGTWCQSWDFSAKGSQESHSKVSGQLWCLTRDMKLAREYISDLNDRLAKIPGALQDHRIIHLPERAEMYVLVDAVGGHWNYVTSKAQFIMAQQRPMWGTAKIKLIENKANGIPLIEEFKKMFVGIKMVEPEGTKAERLKTHSDKFEAGQVVFPPNPTGDRVREQLIKFPRFTWDDEVDTCTQALDRLANRHARYRDQLRKIAGSGSGNLL
jgi:predicted phage terminase large subunit-like protein